MKHKIVAARSAGYGALLGRIAGIINSARDKIVRDIDTTQVYAYWFIGNAIIEHEQGGRARAEYGQQTLINLSRDLTARFGRGFSVDNLENMRRFYAVFSGLFKISETVPRKSAMLAGGQKSETAPRILSWSHYCELLKEDNEKARSFYEIEAAENGWSIVARQKRLTMTNRHYFIDLVLYNRFLKCFVLVDFKRGELTHADAGQMNFYLNYFRENETAEGENPPIGIILCSKKNEVYAKYVLGNLDNKIFASKYKLTLPTEQELHKKLRIGKP